jgi:hypothetical protein
MKDAFFKERAADLIDRITWCDRVKSHSAEYIPAGKGAEIIIAWEAAGICGIGCLRYVPGPLLGLPGLPYEVKEIRIMQRWFVVVNVISFFETFI